MLRLAFAALLVFAAAGLNACTEAFGSRLDERTFRIEGPEVPGGSDAPNRRLAEKLCPKTAFRDFTAVQASPLPANTQLVLQLL